LANLTKFGFVVLDISGKNYFPWTLDAEIYFAANNLGDTIKDENKVPAGESQNNDIPPSSYP
jgi:hypothetical protein